MQPCWNIYRFDFDHYQKLRPLLHAATVPDAFLALVDGPEGEAIAEGVAEGTMTLEEARNAVVLTACCPGDPLPVDTSFPRFLAALARRKGAEHAAETLSALVSGGKAVESWMIDPAGMIGWLTPEETQSIYQSYAVLLDRRGRSMTRIGRSVTGRTRRGGLLGACIYFVRNLFGAGPQPDELLILLGRLLKEASSQSQGLVVTRA